MKLSELKKELLAFPQSIIRFRLPDGALVEAHAHVTEVARIEKRFIDCGGTLRSESFCRLQTWVANDTQHTLSAKKLLGILDKAKSFLETEELEVDVEHELQYISQFPVVSVTSNNTETTLCLGVKHTECLAPDKCGVPENLLRIRPR